MSAAAAAKRRRAGINPQPVTQLPQPNQAERLISNLQNMQNNAGRPQQQQQNQPQQSQQQSRPLNLQQIIQMLDARIVRLEKPTQQVIPAEVSNERVSEIVNEIMAEHLSEFNERSEMLANEIMQLKDIVLSLQQYTMSVNKMLLEERIQILSDIEPVTVSQMEGELRLSDVDDINVDCLSVELSQPVEALEPEAQPIEVLEAHPLVALEPQPQSQPLDALEPQTQDQAIEALEPEPQPVDALEPESQSIEALPTELSQSEIEFHTESQKESENVSFNIEPSTSQPPIQIQETFVSESPVIPLVEPTTIQEEEPEVSAKQSKASNRKKRSTFVLEQE